jgi:hypothetical protein
VYVSLIVCDLETKKRGALGPSGAVTPQNNSPRHTCGSLVFGYARRTLDIHSYFSVYNTLVISVFLVAAHWN